MWRCFALGYLRVRAIAFIHSVSRTQETVSRKASRYLLSFREVCSIDARSRAKVVVKYSWRSRLKRS